MTKTLTLVDALAHLAGHTGTAFIAIDADVSSSSKSRLFGEFHDLGEDAMSAIQNGEIAIVEYETYKEAEAVFTNLNLSFRAPGDTPTSLIAHLVSRNGVSAITQIPGYENGRVYDNFNGWL